MDGAIDVIVHAFDYLSMHNASTGTVEDTASTINCSDGGCTDTLPTGIAVTDADNGAAFVDVDALLMPV